MADINREIQELLVDYTDALRDGCIPSFIKSLSREEGQAIASSGEFWDASEVVRILNSTAFAEKAVTADVGLFMSRVNANIVSRMKKARGTPQPKQNRNSARKTNINIKDESNATE